MSNFTEAVHIVLGNEGHYVNDPVDPGGATNFGVSLRFLKGVGEDIDKDGDVDIDDIKNMSVEDAMDIYQKYWWDKYSYELIEDQALATKIFDLSINMGSKQAHKLIQRACWATGHELVDDGVLGEKSFYAISKSNPQILLGAFRVEAAGFYKTLMKRKPAFEKYRRGWLKRAYS